MIKRRQFLQWAIASGVLTSCYPRQQRVDRPDVPSLQTAFDWKTFAGTRIRLLLNDHPWTTGVRSLLPQFETLTGIETDITIVPEPDYFQAIEDMVRANPPGADAYFLPMDSTAFRQWADSLLHPLTPFINDPTLTAPGYNVFDFPEGFRVAAMYPVGDPNAILYGIPATFEAYILFYNKQLVQQHLGGKLPQTMSELVDAAHTVNQAGQGEVFGAVMRGVPSDAIIDTVTGLILDHWGSDPSPLPYNVWFRNDWETPQFTDPRICKGLETYAQLMQAGPPNIQTLDWPDANRLFREGKAAFYIDASLFAPSFEKPETSAIAGQVGYAPLPRVHAESITGHWLWGLGMPQQARHPEATWYFIQWATSKDIEPQIALATGGAPRFSSWLDPSVYTEAMNVEFALTVQTAMQTSRPTIVLHQRWSEIARAIAQSIQEIYAGADAAAEMERLQAQAMDIIHQDGG
jgi:ABC-type glycerol-3-phosphate transport system substrate-binding protein